MKATNKCSGIFSSAGYVSYFLLLLLSLNTALYAEEYVIVSDTPSSISKIILKVIEKDLLPKQITLPFPLEEQNDCLKNENCIEKVSLLYPQAVLFKLDLMESVNKKEVFLTLLDLKNKEVVKTNYINCSECSLLEIIDQIKSLDPLNKNKNENTNYSLLRNPNVFKYPSIETNINDLKSIKLSTTPQSEVFLKGISIGQTPLEISGTKKQKIKVSFVDINHKKLEKTLSFKKASSFNYELNPIVTSLSLTSSPSRANVYIDGKNIGRTPKVIKKIKLTETLNIKLELENYLDEQITFTPRKEEEEDDLKVNLIRGQGFLRIKHDSDSSKVSVFINKDNSPKILQNYNNGTIVLNAGRNNVVLKKGDVVRKKSFDIKIDEFEDWQVEFVDSVDISISF